MNYLKQNLLKITRVITQMDWIPKGFRFRLANNLFPPKPHNTYHFQVPFSNFTYNGDISNYIDWSVYFFGAYEKEDLMLCVKLLKGLNQKQKEIYLYDVGANIGHHALYLSSYAHKVFAFEPYPVVREKMLAKIRSNHISNIEVVPYGLSDQAGKIPFTAPSVDNLGAGFFSHEVEPIAETASTLSLEVINGDEYILESQVDYPDFIKMDIEGFEPFALSGLQHTLQQARPILMIELSARCAQHIQAMGKSSIFDFLPGQYQAFVRSGENLLSINEVLYNGENYFFVPQESCKELKLEL